MDGASAGKAWGSPAWAGIDPFPEAESAVAYGFPRVGGDRPLIEGYEAGSIMVPPRGRG